MNHRGLGSAIILLVLSSLQAVRAESTLFSALGGEPVLQAVVAQFSDIIVADDRINFAFAQTDMAKFRALLFEQLCQISGGPCRYTGRDMRTAHAQLNITAAEFNALAEDLYRALEHSKIPYRLQNKLVALLAPMERQIVK
jgi:hemoglobin